MTNNVIPFPKKPVRKITRKSRKNDKCVKYYDLSSVDFLKGIANDLDSLVFTLRRVEVAITSFYKNSTQGGK